MLIFLILCAFLLGILSNLKFVIFLLCNLEAISSNFIPVKFSGHTVLYTCSYVKISPWPIQCDGIMAYQGKEFHVCVCLTFEILSLTIGNDYMGEHCSGQGIYIYMHLL